MKVRNMKSSRGNDIANQFILTDAYGSETFQSYGSIIVKRSNQKRIVLDRDKWCCSRTTAKYRNMFLGETTKETEAKIKSGEYVLADLN